MPPLTDAHIRAIKPDSRTRRYSDADGLYLEVTPAGGRYWRHKYRFNGREKRLAHGVYPDTTLAQARAKRDDARTMLRAGVDPGEAKRAAKPAESDDFESIAREWLKREKTHGKGRDGKGLSDETMATTTSRLENHVLRYIGRMPIRQITSADVYDRVLLRIDAAGKAETAHRVKWAISRIFRFAIRRRLADTDPTSALRGELTPVRVESHPGLTDPRAVGALLRAIDGYQGTATVRAALALAPLVFVRPDELNSMEWAHVDVSDTVWRIPANQTKMRRDHLVPLSTQALGILALMRPAGDRLPRYVFPAMGRPGRHMSENTLNGALRALGYDTETEHCAHGFRTTASTLLHELGYDDRVIDVQLAHKDQNKTRGVYNRALYLAQRRKMMQAWADYLDKIRRPGGERDHEQ